HRKNPRHICLQQEWIAIESPCLRTLSFANQVRPGQDESELIALNHVSEPIRLRQCADENEHSAGRYALDFSSVRAQKRNLLQMRIPVSLHDAGVRPHRNLRRLLDLIDQIL